jgi:hypothetical protein
MLAWGVALGQAVTVEPRFWYPIGGFLLAFVLACRWPERRWDLMSASTFFLLLTLLRSWWRPREDRSYVIQRMLAERQKRLEAKRESERDVNGSGPPSVS